MKKLRLFAVCSMALLLMAGTTAQAASKKQGPREAFQRLYPDIKVASMTKTDIEGLYEVMSDGKVAYFHLKTG